MPLQRTWSVHKLLESYPSPVLSSDTINKLHRLSALKPPEEHTPEFTRLKVELEQLVKLVEAVKLVDTSGVEIAPRPPIQEDQIDNDEDIPLGRKLLELSESARKEEGFYAVRTPIGPTSHSNSGDS
ncbi:hypothetical protein DL96DRAFT_1707434 [Flagelloscypha sp. PMI_526]|nr:hypothetical protein DL96DRAFT_1707434 [Flagelloscypha sp. PMI_526]